jgi:hypothetical protein
MSGLDQVMIMMVRDGNWEMAKGYMNASFLAHAHANNSRASLEQISWNNLRGRNTQLRWSSSPLTTDLDFFTFFGSC